MNVKSCWSKLVYGVKSELTKNNKQLLTLLKEQPGQYISGQKLSELLKVSRTAVWKQIRKLEAAGYEFEASSKLGYKLVGEPEQLNIEELKQLMETCRFGQLIQYYDKVGTTQIIAREAAEAGAAEGTLVIAEQQLEGRGRMGRSWLSPPSKGIWMSMVLRPSVPIHFAPQLTLLTAVALCQALRQTTKLPIGIKWPNDLLFEGRKISGILLESVAEEERLKYIIAGVGISVNLEESDYDPELLSKAVSLRMAAGCKLNRSAIIAAFLQQWEQLYDQYHAEGFGPVMALWEQYAVSIGKPAQLITPQGIIIGTPIGLHESGAIRVKLDDGTVKAVFSAEMGELPKL